MNPLAHVVVPVYRGITLTMRCLERLAASGLPADCCVTLIDDASPETGMTEMLMAFIEAMESPAHPSTCEHGRPTWVLLRNAANLGFVASVNRGMALHPDHDVVLLNSDTEVPPGWLQRLRSTAYRRSDIGTVTPFSNCGSLASYPVPSAENALPKNLSLEQLDQLFQTANASVSVDIPTGVGFCLFIRRDCLDDTGGFDEAAFGKGYGEENDFCLRASKRGWTHVLAADCFVFHKGRGSFGEEKDKRVKHAYAVLVDRHPHYPALIQRHFSDDPARPFRLRADVLRLAQDDRGIRLVMAPAQPPPGSPGEPAGTTPALLLSPIRTGHFELRWLNEGEAFRLWFRLPEESSDLHELLLSLHVTEIRGDRQSGLPQALSTLVNSACQNQSPGKGTIALTQLLDLVARHGTPRFTGWQVIPHMLARHGLRMSESRLLRPLAGLLPQAMRSRVRQWIKTNRA